MSGIGLQKPKGLLRTVGLRLSKTILTGGWSSDGSILMVGDTTGGLYAFEGIWKTIVGKASIAQ